MKKRETKLKKTETIKNSLVSTSRLTQTGVGDACCPQAGVEGVQFGSTEDPWQHVEGAMLVIQVARSMTGFISRWV